MYNYLYIFQTYLAKWAPINHIYFEISRLKLENMSMSPVYIYKSLAELCNYSWTNLSHDCDSISEMSIFL